MAWAKGVSIDEFKVEKNVVILILVAELHFIKKKITSLFCRPNGTFLEKRSWPVFRK